MIPKVNLLKDGHKCMQNLLPHDGSAHYFDCVFDKNEANHWLTRIQGEAPWKHEQIMMFGKSVFQPRLSCWMGDRGMSYRYSGKQFQPQAWTAGMIVLKKEVEEKFGQTFNSALLNYYRDGQDSMGLHADDERELGKDPTILSLSFGSKRQLVFRHKTNKEKINLWLEPGSALVMRGQTQTYWKHELPKTKKITEPRLNITFRTIHT